MSYQTMPQLLAAAKERDELRARITRFASKVEAHVNDLRRCAALLSELPQFHKTSAEMYFAVGELSAAIDAARKEAP